MTPDERPGRVGSSGLARLTPRTRHIAAGTRSTGRGGRAGRIRVVHRGTRGGTQRRPPPVRDPHRQGDSRSQCFRPGLPVHQDRLRESWRTRAAWSGARRARRQGLLRSREEGRGPRRRRLRPQQGHGDAVREDAGLERRVPGLPQRRPHGDGPEIRGRDRVGAADEPRALLGYQIPGEEVEGRRSTARRGKAAARTRSG